MPTGLGQSTIDPEEHVIIQETAVGHGLRLRARSRSLAAGGERARAERERRDRRRRLRRHHQLAGRGRALAPVRRGRPDRGHATRTTTSTRTGAARSRPTARATCGDGCDEYRINEVLWRPAPTPGASDGRCFVELAGNIPALPNSELLGGWVAPRRQRPDRRGLRRLRAAGRREPALQRHLRDRRRRQRRDPGEPRPTRIWDSLDLNSPAWPDGPARPARAGCSCSGRTRPARRRARTRPTRSDGPRPPRASATRSTTSALPGRRGPGVHEQHRRARAPRVTTSRTPATRPTTRRRHGEQPLDFCPQASPNPGAAQHPSRLLS